jgi:hypothetical protein
MEISLFGRCLILNAQSHRREWSTGSNNGHFVFPFTIGVVIGNFQIFHYQNNFLFSMARAKEKGSFESFTFYFYSRKIISSKSNQNLKHCL